MKVEVIYCDHCGLMVIESVKGSLRPYICFESCPYNTNSTNAGESAVLCDVCVQELKLEDIGW
jgi:hypothetical protein